MHHTLPKHVIHFEIQWILFTPSSLPLPLPPSLLSLSLPPPTVVIVVVDVYFDGQWRGFDIFFLFINLLCKRRFIELYSVCAVLLHTTFQIHNNISLARLIYLRRARLFNFTSNGNLWCNFESKPKGIFKTICRHRRHRNMIPSDQQTTFILIWQKEMRFYSLANLNWRRMNDRFIMQLFIDFFHSFIHSWLFYFWVAATFMAFVFWKQFFLLLLFCDGSFLLLSFWCGFFGDLVLICSFAYIWRFSLNRFYFKHNLMLSGMLLSIKFHCLSMVVVLIWNLKT